MANLVFPCGCKFKIVGDDTDRDIPSAAFHKLPRVDISLNPWEPHSMYQVSTTCDWTWNLIGEGKTKGVFQLEAQLGRNWSKKTKPHSLEDTGALVALLRPGCLRAMSGDPPKSMTQRYADRKNGAEAITYLHQAVARALEATYGVLVYQEQAMLIAEEVAHFNKQDADVLRKAIGKKKADIMAKVEKDFLEKAEKAGVVTLDEAKEIFSWIRESQKYSFNKCISHDTKLLRVSKGRHSYHPTVEELYLIKNNLEYAKANNKMPLRSKLLRSGGYGYGMSIVDGRVKKNLIKDIQPAGEREVFRITLESGKYIDVTENHKFPTPVGEKKLSEIQIGNTLYTVGRTRRGDKGYPIEEEKIISIESIGIKRTYDVTMDAPNHNFATSQRIITSNSHAVAYGKVSYWSAYIKAHFPISFYGAWIMGAQWKNADKYEEVAELINDAKLNNVVVKTPQLPSITPNVAIIDDEFVQFGMTQLKGIGASTVDKVQVSLEEVKATLGKPAEEWTWVEYLIFAGPSISKTVHQALISVGALDYMGGSRNQKLYEYEQFEKISPKEVEWLQHHFPTFKWKTFREALTSLAPARKMKDKVQIAGGGTATAKREKVINDLIYLIDNPTNNLQDTIEWISFTEEKYLGTPVTATKVEGVAEAYEANTTCREFLEGKDGYMLFGVEVVKVEELRTKAGKTPGAKMARLSIRDATCTIDAVCFPKEWAVLSSVLHEGNTALVVGERTRDGGLSLKRGKEIS